MMKPLLLLSAVVLSGGFTTQVSAMNGRDALASCTANPQCRAHVDTDGGVVINVGGHTIYCPPVDLGECEMVYRRSGKLRAGHNLPDATEAGAANAPAAMAAEAVLKD
ncbi:MAG: hypothetical protein U1E58_07385 [Tabrizicola sp.]